MTAALYATPHVATGLRVPPHDGSVAAAAVGCVLALPSIYTVGVSESLKPTATSTGLFNRLLSRVWSGYLCSSRVVQVVLVVLASVLFRSGQKVSSRCTSLLGDERPNNLQN